MAVPLKVKGLGGGIVPVANVFGNGGTGAGPQTSFAVYVQPGGIGDTAILPLKFAEVAVIFDAVGPVIVSFPLLRSSLQLVAGGGAPVISTWTSRGLAGMLKVQVLVVNTQPDTMVIPPMFIPRGGPETYLANCQLWPKTGTPEVAVTVTGVPAEY